MTPHPNSQRDGSYEGAQHTLLCGINNKTCHRDRIALLTAPCPSHKKLLHKLYFANVDAAAAANAGGSYNSSLAFPGLHPGELKNIPNYHQILPLIWSCVHLCNLTILIYMIKKSLNCSRGFSLYSSRPLPTRNYNHA